MLLGTALAQAMPLLISPLITRLYSPEAFGLLTLFMGGVSALVVIATLRLDLATVLPDSDDEAWRIASVVLAMVGVLTIALVFFAGGAGAYIATRSGYPEHSVWVWLLVFMIPLVAVSQIYTSLASRMRRFNWIAKANVLNQFVYAVSAVVIGIFGAYAEGLVVAKVLGQMICVAIVLVSTSAAFKKVVSWPSWQDVKITVQKYKQFLFFNAPYSLIGTVARDMPIFVFSAMSVTSAAGFYGLARTVLLAPTLLFSNALSQVFYKEAVTLKGDERLGNLTLGMLKLGLLVGAPLFGFVAVWGDIFFQVFFGAVWEQAGMFAMVLAPAAWMSLQTGWPERLFEVAMRQDVSFRVQIGADIITALAVIGPLLLGATPFTAVCSFAITNIVYHIVYLSAMFQVSGFSRRGLISVLLQSWGYFGAFCIALVALRNVPFNREYLGGLSAIIATGLAAVVAIRMWRTLAPILHVEEQST